MLESLRVRGGYPAAVLLVLATIGILRLFPGLPDSSVALLLLLGVFLTAWIWESGPGALAAVRTKKESPQRISARDHRLLSENVTLAMELGAKVVWLSSEDISGELLRFAREHGVTLAIFGKSRISRALRIFRKSPIAAFARLGTGIDVYEIETAP